MSPSTPTHSARAAAAQAARLAAAEAARKAAAAAAAAVAAAAAAAAKAAAAAVKPGTPATVKRPPAKLTRDELSNGKGSALRTRGLAASGGNLKPEQLVSDAERFTVAGLLAAQKAPPAASTLRTEVRGDGDPNCLEKAVNIARPGDSVVLFNDRQDAVGHAVVQKADGSVIDPNRPGAPYASLAQYQQTNTRYENPVTVTDLQAEKILKTPPGEDRNQLITSLGLDAVAGTVVADAWVVTNAPIAPAALEALSVDAKAKADALGQAEQRLQAELSTVGGTFSPEQIVKYKEAFWALDGNKQVKADAAAAADGVAAQVAGAQKQLEAAAAQGDPVAQKALFDSFAVLASSPAHAAEAIGFLGRVNNSPALAAGLKAAYGDAWETKLSEEIAAPAIANAQVELVAKASAEEGGFDAALKDFKALIAPIETAKSLKSLAADVKSAVETIPLIRSGTFTPETLAAQLGEGWESKSKFGKAMATASLGMALYDMPKALIEGDYVEGLTHALSITDAGFEMAIGLTKAVGKVDTAASIARFGGKFLPYVGLASDAVQAYQDIQALRDGVSVSDVFNLAGSAVALVGDVAGLIPGVGTLFDIGTTLISETLRLVGSLVSGDLFKDDPTAADWNEMKQVLQSAFGLDNEQSTMLIEYSRTSVPEDLRRLGITGEAAVQRLTQRDPLLLGDPSVVDGREKTGYALNALAAYGISGAAASDILATYGNELGAYLSQMQAYGGLAFGQARNSGDPAEFRKVFSEYLRDHDEAALADAIDSAAQPGFLPGYFD
jgi:hypothetical protein